MRVTDAQVHIWTQHQEERPERMGPNFPLERLQQEMAGAGVDRVVLVPSRKLTPDDAVAGNAYPLEAARRFPERFAVMGLIDLGRPGTPAELDATLAEPGMKGLRIILKREKEEDMQWVAGQAVRRGFPIAILVNRGTLPPLLPVLERNPDLSLVIDHAGLPALGPDPFADLDQMLALAKYPNVVVKVSALTRWSKEPYPFRDVHGHIRRIYDAFGPQRMAWGSDFTWEVGRIPYRECVDLFRESCDFLSASDREWILDKTMSRVLQWDA